MGDLQEKELDTTNKLKLFLRENGFNIYNPEYHTAQNYFYLNPISQYLLPNKVLTMIECHTSEYTVWIKSKECSIYNVFRKFRTKEEVLAFVEERWVNQQEIKN